MVLICLNKAVKFLSILINTLWTHRCSVFTKDLSVIKIRVAHLFSVLCSPTMYLYVLGSVLWFPHANDGRFIFTSSCLQKGSCLISVICVCLRTMVSNAHCVRFVFVFVWFLFFVLCDLHCKFLWIVHFVLSLQYSLSFIDISTLNVKQMSSCLYYITTMDWGQFNSYIDVMYPDLDFNVLMMLTKWYILRFL